VRCRTCYTIRFADTFSIVSFFIAATQAQIRSIVINTYLSSVTARLPSLQQALASGSIPDPVERFRVKAEIEMLQSVESLLRGPSGGDRSLVSGMGAMGMGGAIGMGSHQATP
jgi:hypothetical protein